MPNVKRETNASIQLTRLRFAKAIGLTVKTGLSLLGIKTLERM